MTLTILTMVGSRRRRWLRRLLSLAVVGLLLYVYRIPLLRSVAGVLVAAPTETAADTVLIVGEREPLAEALRLLQDGTVAQVLVIQRRSELLLSQQIVPTEVEECRRELMARGIANPRVAVMDETEHNDWGTARSLHAWCEAHPDQRVLVLCDRFDSQRQKVILSRVLQPETMARVQVRGVASATFDENSWWRSKEGKVSLFNAFVGLGYVALFGEDQEEWQTWDPVEYERALRQQHRQP